MSPTSLPELVRANVQGDLVTVALDLEKLAEDLGAFPSVYGSLGRAKALAIRDKVQRIANGLEPPVDNSVDL